MTEKSSWNWQTEKRLVADVSGLKDAHEMVVSPDGERIVASVMREADDFGLSTNGGEPEGEFERAWQLKHTPDGKLVGLVRIDDEWTVMVDGKAWEETFDFVWDLRISQDGSTVAAQIKDGPKYSIIANGEPWDGKFLSMRNWNMSADGKHIAATVQLETLPEADTVKFMEGTWGVAVDGQAWEKKYINVYAPAFSPDGTKVSVEARTGIAEYTVSENDTLWPEQFGMVWEPCYRSDSSILVPAKVAGGWTLVENGREFWKKKYVQLWHQKVSPDGNRIAAVVAIGWGRWTIAVDDTPWGVTFGDMVQAPRFSQSGKRVAAIVKDSNRWTIAADGAAWSQTFDMVWDPILSSNDEFVAAKVELDKKYAIAVNGKVGSGRYEKLWDPTFSPDGTTMLVRGVQDGKYYREVVPAGTLL